ncbi:putative serine/threonine-protein kinase WNK7 [Capsicum annuum]|uniref:non-specific serine/threonine protein kinase n=1 Tax=Capsicum annuum TaxID=4072 RepID=A0A2G2ZT05_CAPAN|nr:putative serine/threonine-protein kinase WNK7 [Capsicum annuum]
MCFSYKAFDLHDGIEGTWSRVKVEDVLQSPDKLGKLYVEMHFLRKLKHGNIMKFCDSWVDDKKRTFNMITELFTSGNLREYRKKYRSIDTKAIKNWESRGFIRIEFKLTGKKKDENSVSLTLRIKSHSGRVRNIHFNFYLYTDTALLFAAEMVEHLELADHDVDFIADFIDYLIMKILPSWKPSDYFSSGGRSQREEAIENYLTLSPITTTSNARQDGIPVLNMNSQIGSTHRVDECKLYTNSSSTSCHVTFASPSHLENV